MWNVLAFFILHCSIITSSSAFLSAKKQSTASRRNNRHFSLSFSASDIMPPNVRSLVDQAKVLFDESFGKDDENLSRYCVSAPGRVNLIGEHVDYTGGFVLPLAIGYNTVGYGCGAIKKATHSKPNKCRVVSANNPVVEFYATSSLEPSSGHNKWANYVQGVILQYLPDLNEDEALTFDLAIVGDVPLGSGLSSSASLEVATAVFLEKIFDGVAYRSSKGGTTLSEKQRKMERAVRCKLAENIFCGVPCGIMDQFVSSAGCDGKLLLLDCRSLDYREVSMGDQNSNSNAPVLVITNSNVKHDLGGGEYPIRVKQCTEATAILTKMNPSIHSLRDATMKDVEAATKSAGLDGVLLQRARHVVSENERTVKTADALEKGDWEAVGSLMNDSHASMRDDYEVSCEEIDILVDLAQKFDGVYGSRLTGGGFGGCTVTLVKKNVSQDLIEYLKKQYEAMTGTECVCFETSPAAGAKAIEL